MNMMTLLIVPGIYSVLFFNKASTPVLATSSGVFISPNLIAREMFTFTGSDKDVSSSKLFFLSN